MNQKMRKQLLDQIYEDFYLNFKFDVGVFLSTLSYTVK